MYMCVHTCTCIHMHERTAHYLLAKMVWAVHCMYGNYSVQCYMCILVSNIAIFKTRPDTPHHSKHHTYMDHIMSTEFIQLQLMEASIHTGSHRDKPTPSQGWWCNAPPNGNREYAWAYSLRHEMGWEPLPTASSSFFTDTNPSLSHTILWCPTF